MDRADSSRFGIPFLTIAVAASAAAAVAAGAAAAVAATGAVAAAPAAAAGTIASALFFTVAALVVSLAPVHSAGSLILVADVASAGVTRVLTTIAALLFVPFVAVAGIAAAAVVLIRHASLLLKQTLSASVSVAATPVPSAGK